MTLDELQNEAWVQILLYPIPTGTHPNEKIWRERCKLLLDIALEQRSQIKEQERIMTEVKDTIRSVVRDIENSR